MDPQSRGTTAYQKGLAPAAAIPMGSGSGKSYPDTSHFVPEIESIMGARGLAVGARLQGRWKSGKANRLAGAQADGQGDRGPLAVETVSMDWILRFERARALFAQAQDPTFVFTKRAKELLQSRVEKKMRTTRDTTVQLGSYVEGLAREKEYIQNFGLTNYDVYLGGIDDLNAAMGRFAMFIIPLGGAFLTPDSNYKDVMVEVDELGIYARDSFDFEGRQGLGKWRLPNEAEMTDMDLYPLPPVPAGDWAYMSNAAYITYRERTGMGEDFLVYSDIRPVKLVERFRFTFPIPEGILTPPTPQKKGKP